MNKTNAASLALAAALGPRPVRSLFKHRNTPLTFVERQHKEDAAMSKQHEFAIRYGSNPSQPHNRTRSGRAKRASLRAKLKAQGRRHDKGIYRRMTTRKPSETIDTGRFALNGKNQWSH